jgi:hypothetical protein
MRIRQAVPPPREESLVALRFNMPFLRSSRRFWNLEAIKISLLRSCKFGWSCELGTPNSKIWSASILAPTAVGLASAAAPSGRSYE